MYRELGPGLLESIYEAAICYQLTKDGLKVRKQVPVEVVYDGIVLPVEYRLDLLVEDKVVVEIKSVETFKKKFDTCGSCSYRAFCTKENIKEEI